MLAFHSQCSPAVRYNLFAECNNSIAVTLSLSKRLQTTQNPSTGSG